MAADAVFDRTGYPIVLLGSRTEIPLVETVRQAMHAPARSLAGRLDLAELAAAIGKASVLIANNSGPAHIAAAVGTPVVDLYALTNRQHTPWRVPSRVLSHDVPCRDCLRSECPLGHNACLQAVEPRAVADAACELLRWAT
jgi:ADP-heptose:LPS heptosyltransferase